MSEPCAPPTLQSATKCRRLWRPSGATSSWKLSHGSLVSTSSTSSPPYVPLLPAPASYFCRPWDFPDISCCSQSRTIYSYTISALYRTVELNRTSQCCATLDMLYEHPDIARHVQKLVVRQGGCPGTPRSVDSFPTCASSHADSDHVCAAVKRVATRLDALQTFVWGGEEYPLDDSIWLALRESYVPFPRSFRAW